MPAIKAFKKVYLKKQIFSKGKIDHDKDWSETAEEKRNSKKKLLRKETKHNLGQFE